MENPPSSSSSCSSKTSIPSKKKLQDGKPATAAKPKIAGEGAHPLTDPQDGVRERNGAVGGEDKDLAACLAGLGSFTQQLCSLCEAGTHMGALWATALAGSHDSDVARRLCEVLAELTSLAQLEQAQLRIGLDSAAANNNHVKQPAVDNQENVVAASLHQFILLQQQFFQFGSERLSQLANLNGLDLSDGPIPLTPNTPSTPGGAMAAVAANGLLNNHTHSSALTSSSINTHNTSNCLTTSRAGTLGGSVVSPGLHRKPVYKTSSSSSQRISPKIAEEEEEDVSAGQRQALEENGAASGLKADAGKKLAGKGSALVSQEELDSVIDILSRPPRSSVSGSTMETIPEQPPPSVTSTASKTAASSNAANQPLPPPPQIGLPPQIRLPSTRMPPPLQPGGPGLPGGPPPPFLPGYPGGMPLFTQPPPPLPPRGDGANLPPPLPPRGIPQQGPHPRHQLPPPLPPQQPPPPLSHQAAGNSSLPFGLPPAGVPQQQELAGSNGGAVARYPPHSQRQEQPAQQRQQYHQHQRQRSDGLIGDQLPAGPKRETTKTNTWPFRPGARSNQDQMQGQMFGAYEGFSHDLEYNQYLNAVKQASSRGLGAGGGSSMGSYGSGSGPGSMGYNPWSTSDGSKQWGSAGFSSDHSSVDYGVGSATARPWSSGGVEESSCSDESSSNGEMHQWMMGLDLMGQMKMERRRRHSSGGENKLTDSINAHLPPDLPQAAADDLLEPKSTNTWPPKNPWAAKSTDPLAVGSGSKMSLDAQAGASWGMGHPGADLSAQQQQLQQQQQQQQQQQHKPLSAQWSDPLAHRSLSVWEPGNFDNLAGLGNTNELGIPKLHERKFSLM